DGQPGELAAAARKAVPEGHGADVGARPQVRVGPHVEVAGHGRGHQAHATLAVPQILKGPYHGIVRERLDGAVLRARLARRDALEHAEVEAAREPPRELAGADDRRARRRARVPVQVREMGRPADATGVEEAFTV